VEFNYQLKVSPFFKNEMLSAADMEI